MTRALRLLFAAVLALGCVGSARADDAMDDGAEATPRPAAIGRNGLEYLVPELIESPYRLDDGARQFEHRLSVSPAYGALGSERMFAFRVAYNPNAWLGYEGSIGHNPGQSVHAVLHSLSALVRRPLPGRFQPYARAGYGMVLVFPAQSINADPVTKNALTIGGGLEFYIRNDLALRGDVQSATVIGRQRDREGTVAYDYVEYTFGLAFYRSIRP